MVRRIFKVMVPVGMLALLSAVLFAGAVAFSGPEWLRWIAREIQAACRDTGTQWMVVVCLVSYFVAFLFLERRILPRENTKSAENETVTLTSPRPSPLPAGAEREKIFAFLAFFRGIVRNRDLWLAGFLALVLLRYVFGYEAAVRSMQVVVLLTGIVLGKGVALWAAWGDRQWEHSTLNIQHSTPNRTFSRHLTPALSPSEAERERASARRMTWMLFGVCTLLGISALWQPEIGAEFHYRGIRRWEGVWDNPNTYGVLMGVGLVLAVGLLASGVWRLVDGGKRSTPNVQHPISRRGCAWLPASARQSYARLGCSRVTVVVRGWGRRWESDTCFGSGLTANDAKYPKTKLQLWRTI